VSTLAKSLLEEKLGLWEQVKGLNERATAEKRGFNAEETAQRTNLMDAIDSLDKRTQELISDEKRMAEAGAQYADFNSRQPVNGVESTNVEKRFNEEVRKVYRKQSDGFDVSAVGSRILRRIEGIGQRPLHPVEARTILDNYLAGGTPGSFTNPSGAGIVPIDFYDNLISYLVEVSGIMQTGPTVLHTAGGEPIQMPIVAQHTGQLTGSNVYANLSAQQAQPFQSADPVFSQKLLSSNKFGILVQVPRELLDDSGVNLLGYLATSAGRSIGNVVGNALVNGGSGVTGPLLSSVPVSVTGVSGVSGTAASANGVIEGGPRYQDLVNLQYSVIAPYRQSRSCYWLAADQSLGTLRLLTDNVGRPIWEPSTVLGTPDLLLGKPIIADPFMAAIGVGTTSVVFGDFSQFAIRLIGDMRFERSDDFAFNTDLVSFRAVLRMDANLLNVTPVASFPRSQPLYAFKGGSS
jgi:HK97 family phage major capsid protein